MLTYPGALWGRLNKFCQVADYYLCAPAYIYILTDAIDLYTATTWLNFISSISLMSEKKS